MTRPNYRFSIFNVENGQVVSCLHISAQIYEYTQGTRHFPNYRMNDFPDSITSVTNYDWKVEKEQSV